MKLTIESAKDTLVRMCKLAKTSSEINSVLILGEQILSPNQFPESSPSDRLDCLLEFVDEMGKAGERIKIVEDRIEVRLKANTIY